ncbi:MAG: hypothetical protein AB8H79_14810 [Myxococcota bacterium]
MRWLTLLALTAACREPFGTDRHDLVGLRVAAISAQPTADDTVKLSVLAVVDGRAWTDSGPTFAWYDATGLSTAQIAELGDGPPLATGPSPELAGPPPQAIALLASHTDSTWRGTLNLPAPGASAATIDSMSLRTIPLELSTINAEDTVLDARRALEAGPEVTHLAEGQLGRLQAQVSEGARVRWMSTLPSGTFLELDEVTTDWAPGSLVVDGEDVDDRTADAPGPRTIVALALNAAEDGANGWAVRELWVGEPNVGILTPSGRWIGTDAPVDGAFVQGTIQADDTAPTGITLTNVVSVPPETEHGTAALPCAVPVSGPFDPTWLMEHRCDRAAVVGATVVVQVAP